MLGLGLATLTSAHGAVALTVADVPGVDVAGLTVDAGPVESPALMQVGTPHRHRARRASDPAPDGAAGRLLPGRRARTPAGPDQPVVNSDHVMLDDIWAWRADHGNGVGWT